MLNRSADFSSLETAATTEREIIAKLNAGGDPHCAMRHLDRQIIAFQGAGADLPVSLIRLASQIARERRARVN